MLLNELREIGTFYFVLPGVVVLISFIERFVGNIFNFVTVCQSKIIQYHRYLLVLGFYLLARLVNQTSYNSNW